MLSQSSKQELFLKIFLVKFERRTESKSNKTMKTSEGKKRRESKVANKR